MFQNEAGIKVYEEGDVVRVGKGKVEWTVTDVWADGTVNLMNMANNRVRRSSEGELTLVRSAELPRVTEDLETGDEVTTQEHTRGESPAEYEARTGVKLDGRTTRYGRAVLAALQRKAHVFEGAKRGKRRAR